MATQAGDTPRTTIGGALVGEGVITEEQLARALRIQGLLEEPKQLGDLLVELGYAKSQSISDVIVKHGGNMRLGEMLIEQGIIRRDTLDAALAKTQEQKMRLGEALIEIGAINERILLRNIAHQSHAPYIEPSFAMIEERLLSGVSPDYLQKHCFVPFSKSEDECVTVVVCDLDDQEVRRAVEDLFHGKVEFALGPSEVIERAIEEFRRRQNGGGDKRGRAGAEDDEAAVRLVESLLGGAVEEGASDIHIEPMANLVRVRYRIDGVLVYKTDLPKNLHLKVISRIKILGECNISEHQRHQGGRMVYCHGDKEVDIRLSIYVSIFGESAVLRLLNKDMALMNLTELGMAPAMLERFRDDVLDLPTGVVLITGPTGSGKTSTLYSSIAYSNDVSRKIITAEDPAEYTIEGIVQCSIHEKAGRDFEATLREIVRQDPDIIVLGEIRDATTARVAIQAALTGHKVYSTFHTEDTIGGLLRLVDMDIEAFLIASTAVAIVAQRLLRRICPHCAMPYTPGSRELTALGLDVREARSYEYKIGRGCGKCTYTGFKGRVAAYELLVLNEPVKNAILQKNTAHEIREISVATTGLVSVREDAIGKVLKGVTTFGEVLKHTPRTFSMRSLSQIVSLCQ